MYEKGEEKMAIIENAREEIIRLEKMLRKIDSFLSNAPDGCLKWQNKKGKTYYYQQYLENDVKTERNTNDSNKWNRRYIKKDNLGFARALAQKHYYSFVKPIVEKQLKEFIGHTPLQVLCGAILGIITALIIV